MIEHDKKPFKIDITLFGKDGEPEVNSGYGSLDDAAMAMMAAEGGTAPVEPAPAAPPTDPAVPAPAPLEPVAPAAPAEPVAPIAPPTAPVQDIMQNPIVQQLIQQSQMLQQTVQQQSEMMKQFIQNSMTNNAPQPSPVVMKTPEEMEAEKEAFMEKFYANPMGVLDEHAEMKVKAATDPLNAELASYRNEKEWNNAVGSMAANAQQFPEFENVRGRMSEIIKEKPYLMQSGDKSKALSDAYAIAMSEKAPAAQVTPAPSQPVNPADMMKDPNFIAQFLANPEAMKMLAMAQATQIQNNSQQVPPMSPSSGITNAAPYITNSPNNYDEADTVADTMLKQGLVS